MVHKYYPHNIHPRFPRRGTMALIDLILYNLSSSQTKLMNIQLNTTLGLSQHDSEGHLKSSRSPNYILSIVDPSLDNLNANHAMINIFDISKVHPSLIVKLRASTNRPPNALIILQHR